MFRRKESKKSDFEIEEDDEEQGTVHLLFFVNSQLNYKVILLI